MKIHHLNCGSFCPLVSVLGEITHCHCLLIESSQGLILLDTGLSKSHENRVLKSYEKAAGISYDRFLTAKENLIQKGFKPSDVRHILITHLDFDHAGGLLDFPKATLHIYKKELKCANSSGPHILRYQKELWKTHKNIITYSDEGEDWNGFKSIQPLSGHQETILMVPLIGHTLGHAGFAIKTDENKWLFHTGDAYYNNLEFSNSLKSIPYKTLARLAAMDNQNRIKNLEKLRELRSQKNLTLCNSHDPKEFNQFF